MSEISIMNKGNELWACKGKYSILIAIVGVREIVLQPVDEVMASVIGLEIDSKGYAVVERSFTE